MSTVIATTLVLATVAVGLTAGFLGAFAHTVMPALGKGDDARYVGTFQALDRAVYNPWFMVPFTAAPVLVGAALVMTLVDRGAEDAVPVAGAFVLAVATVVVTGVVHLPLNAAIGEVALDAPAAELAAARARFEGRWERWNVVRTLTSVGALVCLALAMLRLG